MDKSNSQDYPHEVTTQITFPSERLAQIVYDVLRVDAEPKRSLVTKELLVSDKVLSVIFRGGLARHLRVAVNNFYSNVDLVLGTVDAFGPPVSDTYDHY